MARRRMITAEFVDEDRFMDLPVEVQMLYIYMNLHADDEGFVPGTKRMANMYQCPQGLQLLEQEDFIIRFPSGVVVLVDWYRNNTVRKDRSMATFYQTERSQLQLLNGRYVLLETTDPTYDNQLPTMWQPLDNQMTTTCQPNVNQVATQNRIDNNIIENNIINHNISEENKIELPAGKENQPPADRKQTYPDFLRILDYCQENHLENVPISDFWSHYESNGWTDDWGNPIEDWIAVLRQWDAEAKKGGLASSPGI